MRYADRGTPSLTAADLHRAGLSQQEHGSGIRGDRLPASRPGRGTTPGSVWGWSSIHLGVPTHRRIKVPLLLLVQPGGRPGGRPHRLTQALAQAGRFSWILDHCQDFHLALALGACQNVYLEGAAEQVSPWESAWAQRRQIRLDTKRIGIGRRVRLWARPRGEHFSTKRRGGRQHPMIGQ
jgi:hypothetical protein